MQNGIKKKEHKPFQSVLSFTLMRHSCVLFCCLDKMKDRKKEHDETVAGEKVEAGKKIVDNIG